MLPLSLEESNRCLGEVGEKATSEQLINVEKRAGAVKRGEIKDDNCHNVSGREEGVAVF